MASREQAKGGGVSPEGRPAAEGRVSADGTLETVLATLASGSLAALIAFIHPRGYPWWQAGIAVTYVLSLRLSLRIHALTYRDGAFRGKPLLGRPVEFRGTDLASLARDDRSRPPRARLALKDGRRLLVKRPLWMGSVTAADFESRVRERLAGLVPGPSGNP